MGDETQDDGMRADRTYCNTIDDTKMSPFPRGADSLFELLSSLFATLRKRLVFGNRSVTSV